MLTKRSASTILTIIGGVGVVVTTIMAVKATPKALKKIEEAEEIKGEELTTMEIVKTAGPVYIPSILIGASTIACVFGANVLNKRQQAALMSAYALVDNAYKDYKRKNIELYGEESHHNILDALAVEKAKEVGITADSVFTSCSLIDHESCGEPVLFYDEWSKRYFTSTIERVMDAVYHYNRNFTLRGYAMLNELYEFLGLEETEYGDTVGWTVEDELYWIDFDFRRTELEDGLEVIVIETPWGPSADLLEYYWG